MLLEIKNSILWNFNVESKKIVSEEYPSFAADPGQMTAEIEVS